MGPGVLIAFLAGVALSSAGSLDNASSPVTPAMPDSVAPPKDTARVDSAKGARARHLLPAAWHDRSSAWSLPVRAGSAGGALDEAFREGAWGVPWRRNFEFDGMYESWSPWTGLPLEERPSRLSWEGPSLAGAGDAGPLSGSSVAARTTAGFGGMPLREIRLDSVPSDTPSTSIHFFRGALASYRFGLDFTRAVIGPWGLHLSTETRSAQSRAWMYRDQIQDMFQGSFGRNREELPAQGHSPGQDDVQWEMAIVRGDSLSRLELGWAWTDLRRGIPNPAKTWQGPDLAPTPGQEGRSGWFGRWIREEDGILAKSSFRVVSETWNWLGWTDSGAPVPVSGDLTREEADVSVRKGSAQLGLGLEGRGRIATGTRSVPSLLSDVDEDQERGGAFVDGRTGSLGWRAQGGWTRISTTDGRILGQPDWKASAEWTDSVFAGSVAVSRSAVLPDEELERPDPLLRTLPAVGLVSETRDLAELRGRIQLPAGFALDAAGAFLIRQHAQQPLTPPGPEAEFASREDALRPIDAGGTLGWSSEAGLGWTGERWRVRTLWSVGATGLPGSGLSESDPRIPTWKSRSTVGWHRDLLGGRLRLRFDADLSTWSESWTWNAAAGDTLAHALRLPSASQLDLELQVGIKTFVIDWRIENVLDSRQIPAAGWTPPGIRAGWGIAWNFGG